MQACLSSSSPFGQSMKPSQRTWSSIHLYLPILSGVGHANRSIPSSAWGHSVKEKGKIKWLRGKKVVFFPVCRFCPETFFLVLCLLVTPICSAFFFQETFWSFWCQPCIVSRVFVENKENGKPLAALLHHVNIPSFCGWSRWTQEGSVDTLL